MAPTCALGTGSASALFRGARAGAACLRPTERKRVQDMQSSSDSEGRAWVMRPRSQAIARTALLAALVLLGTWTVRPFLPALAWAAIFGIALWPLYERTQRRWPPGRHNVLLPALFTAAVALVFILPVVLVLFEAAREARDILQWVRDIQASGLPMPEWISRLPFGAQIGAWWRSNLATPAEQSEFLKRISHEWLPGLTREFGSQLVH